MKIRKLKISCIICAAPIVFGLSACAPNISAERPAASSTSDLSDATIIEASWAFDLFDQKKLAGASDAIFVGSVIEQIGDESRLEALPETQFRVQVIQTLKGEVPGEVTVSQQGGLDRETGKTVLLEGDPIVLVGKSYIFSTGFDSSRGWYTATPMTGHVELSDSDASTMKNPSARSPEPSDVTDMKNSIREEIPFEVGAESDPEPVVGNEPLPPAPPAPEIPAPSAGPSVTVSPTPTR